MMLNKTFHLILLSLIPLLGFSQANSQYPDSGNKIRLGFQTTGDGLIWRDTQPKVGGYQPINNKAAWIILDTINNKFYHYKNSTWTLAGGQDIDTANLIATKYDLGFKLATTDTGNMLTPYLRKADTTSIAYVNTYGAQTVNGTKTLTSNLILKNSQEPSRATVVTTQGFAADTTNWTRGTGWTFNGTQAVATAATGDLTYTPSLTITSGNAYEITYTVTGYSAGTLTARLGNASFSLPTHNATANVILLLPTSATGGFRFTTSTFTGNLDNVSVVEISNAAPILLSGQDDGSSTLYNSLRIPNVSTFAFGGGGSRTTGTANNIIGLNAGLVHTSGLNNNFFGTNAGFSNTSASANNFFGLNAGYSNTRADNNNFFGTNAGFSNTTGIANNFIGRNSGLNNTTGIYNIFFGLDAGLSNTSGNGNIAIGYDTYNQTDGVLTTGSNNVFIGPETGKNIQSSASGNVIIGYLNDLPVATGSDQVVIKNIIYATGASGTGTTSAGNVGIGTNAPLSKLNIMGTVRINSAAAPDANYFLQLENSSSQKAKANAWDTYSDKRIKTDIQPIFNAIDKVNLLNPVYYQKHDSYVENDFLNIDFDNSVKSLGFIAQEVYNVIPEAVNTGTTNELWAMDYSKIIPILTKAIQEQQALIKALEQRILILENK